MSDAHLLLRPADPTAGAHRAPVRRGLGVVGAFVTGLVAAVIVLAGALISLPYWPQEARALWRGQAACRPPGARHRPAGRARRRRRRRQCRGRCRQARAQRCGSTISTKRLRALSATRRAADGRAAAGSALVAELRSKRRGAGEQRRGRQPAPRRRSRARATPMPKRKSPRCARDRRPAHSASRRSTRRLPARREPTARDQAKALSDAVGASNAGEQKALARRAPRR